MNALADRLPVEQGRAFLSWWQAELAAMLPDVLRERASPPRADIRLTPGEVVIERVTGTLGEQFVDPRPLAEQDEESWAQLAEIIAGTRARFVLTSPAVHVARLSLPKAARARLVSAIALQVPEISPVDPSSVIWRHQIVGDTDTRILVDVIFVRQAMIDEIEAMCAARDIGMPAIAADVHGVIVDLTRGHDDSVTQQDRANRRAIAIAAGLLATVPITTLAAAWLLQAQAEARAETLVTQLRPKLAADQRARALDKGRKAVNALADTVPVSSRLALLGPALAEPVYVRSLEQQGDTVLVTVVAADPEALVAGVQKVPGLAGTQLVNMVPDADDRLAATLRLPPS